MTIIKILFIVILFVCNTLVESESTRRFKREDESDIASSIGLGFSAPESEIPISKSEESEFEKMAIVQNLNYLTDILRNLNEEKDKLEALWKSSTTESQLQKAAKALWEKTKQQIDLLDDKKEELTKTLKSLSFSKEEFSHFDELNATTTASSKKPENSPSHLSRAICQFFVFGTLFGVVVTITACSCFLQPKEQNRSSSTSNLNLNRIPEPFDYSKPCFLKADSSGRFYASPIDGEEIPPLPTYEDALNLPIRIVVDTETQTNQPKPSSPMLQQIVESDPKTSDDENIQIERY